MIFVTFCRMFLMRYTIYNSFENADILFMLLDLNGFVIQPRYSYGSFPHFQNVTFLTFWDTELEEPF